MCSNFSFKSSTSSWFGLIDSSASFIGTRTWEDSDGAGGGKIANLDNSLSESLETEIMTLSFWCFLKSSLIFSLCCLLLLFAFSTSYPWRFAHMDSYKNSRCFCLISKPGAFTEMKFCLGPLFGPKAVSIDGHFFFWIFPTVCTAFSKFIFPSAYFKSQLKSYYFVILNSFRMSHSQKAVQTVRKKIYKLSL